MLVLLVFHHFKKTWSFAVVSFTCPISVLSHRLVCGTSITLAIQTAHSLLQKRNSSCKNLNNMAAVDGTVRFLFPWRKQIKTITDACELTGQEFLLLIGITAFSFIVANAIKFSKNPTTYLYINSRWSFHMS